jgi:hypothetical protein
MNKPIHIYIYIYIKRVQIYAFTCVYMNVHISLLSTLEVKVEGHRKERVFLNIYNNQYDYDMLTRYIYSRQRIMYEVLYEVFHTII